MSLPGEGSTVRYITCEGVTKPLPLYSHATVHNGIVYVSCVQGFIPGTFEFPSAAAEDQARQVLTNLKTILEQAGSSLGRVLKITIFMTDMRDFPKINEAVSEAFPESPPARSSIAVAELPRNAKVVIEAIAAVQND
jgi:2-iminobutanoate/2-iminopropanoate deaminase